MTYRHLSLAEALVVAEVVTGIPAAILSSASRVELLESALQAPQAGFGDAEFYPELLDKAAVLVVRIARNHPLPDGNERLAWQSLTLFCALNGFGLEVGADEAVEAMLEIAAGTWDEDRTAAWLRTRIGPAADTDDSGWPPRTALTADLRVRRWTQRSAPYHS